MDSLQFHQVISTTCIFLPKFLVYLRMHAGCLPFLLDLFHKLCPIIVKLLAASSNIQVLDEFTSPD